MTETLSLALSDKAYAALHREEHFGAVGLRDGLEMLSEAL
jgi:hypothetical protein